MGKLRIDGRNRGERGEIDRIIDADLRVRAEAAAKHCARAGVAWAGADRKDQRIGLEIADPDRVEALVENSEGRQESSDRDRDIWIGDEIHLSVIYFLLEGAVKAGAAGLLHHVVFEGVARLD